MEKESSAEPDYIRVHSKNDAVVLRCISIHSSVKLLNSNNLHTEPALKATQVQIVCSEKLGASVKGEKKSDII